MGEPNQKPVKYNRWRLLKIKRITGLLAPVESQPRKPDLQRKDGRMSKIIRLEAENIKRLKAVCIEPNGKPIVATAKAKEAERCGKCGMVGKYGLLA